MKDCILNETSQCRKERIKGLALWILLGLNLCFITTEFIKGIQSYS